MKLINKRSFLFMWAVVTLSSLYFLVLLFLNIQQSVDIQSGSTFLPNLRGKRFTDRVAQPETTNAGLLADVDGNRMARFDTQRHKEVQYYNDGNNHNKIDERGDINKMQIEEDINKPVIGKEKSNYRNEKAKNFVESEHQEVYNKNKLIRDSLQDHQHHQFKDINQHQQQEGQKIDVAGDNKNSFNPNKILQGGKMQIPKAVLHNLVVPPKVPFQRNVGNIKEAGPLNEHKNRTLVRQFYKLRKVKVNEFVYDYLETGNDICKEGESVYLVIACLTTYFDIDTREAIRDTWGSVARTQKWPSFSGTIPGVKLVFLLGNPGNHAVKRAIIKDESERYNDLVVADFTDSYYNLTLKVMLGLKWTRDYCRQAKYFVKIDQDMFLHVHNLVMYLSKRQLPEHGEVIGFQNPTPKVLRTGVWGVPWSMFPFTSFPNYTNGNSYVISGNIVSKLFTATERLPFLFIEDAFITGVARYAIHADIVHCPGFTRWGERAPKICGFHNSFRIAATNSDDDKKREIWRALHYRNVKNCYNITTRQQT